MVGEGFHLAKDWSMRIVGQKEHTVYRENSTCKGPGVERELDVFVDLFWSF